MTRLHISENCKQLKIMSITINICIDNALFYLFHITPEQSWSHGNSFLQVQNLVYSTFYINPNSKILPIKSFIFVNLKFHYCLGRKKSSSLQQQKRGGEKKRRYGNRCQGLSAGFCSISLRNSVCILGI